MGYINIVIIMDSGINEEEIPLALDVQFIIL